MVLTSSLFLILEISMLHSCHYAVVLFRSREHEHCGPQPGFVRAHIESIVLYFSF